MNWDETRKKADEDQKNVELRSEKVRNIIGQVPPFLIRWGNTVLAIIFIALLILYFFLL